VETSDALIGQQYLVEEDLHCIFVHKLLCKVVRHAFDTILSASVAICLTRLEIAFRLVPLAFSACSLY
jgi:hypothetical protein